MSGAFAFGGIAGAGSASDLFGVVGIMSSLCVV
jgi:hypothetical protein